MGVNELDIVVVYRGGKGVTMAAHALRMHNKILSNVPTQRFVFQRDYLAAAKTYEATRRLSIEKLDLSPLDFRESKMLNGNFIQRLFLVESLNCITSNSVLIGHWVI